jgi:hypothetical protein
MTEGGGIDRILADNLYLVLGTVDGEGNPWVTPVFFAPLGRDRVCWVSSPDSRHSRNLVRHPGVAITVFDSRVPVGHAEAAYFDADAFAAGPDEVDVTLQAMNARLPERKRLSVDDVVPSGPMVIYTAALRRRFVLVRGGDPEHGNTLDMTVEV